MRAHNVSGAGLLVLFLGGTSAWAQEQGSAYKEVGNVHFAVSCTAAAQEQFDHAVALLHSFFWPETIKAFNAVLATDPTCTMGYWGLAISQRPNPLIGAPDLAAQKRGWEAVEKARTISAKTARETDYIGAMETLYRDYDKFDYHSRVVAYTAAMEQIHRRYPDDSEGAIFYALALNESEDLSDTTLANQRKAAAILEKAFAEQPLHPGAAHYLIHSYDYPALAADGLPAARKYAALAPASPHARHMPSHIFSMLGQWQDLIKADTNSLVAAEAYADKNFGGATTGGMMHSMDFLTYAYLQTGQDQKAKAVLAKRDSVAKWANRLRPGDMGYAAIPVRYALERGQWSEAAALQPVESQYPQAVALGHFARALGAARSGQPDAAAVDIAKLGELSKKLTDSGDRYWAEQVMIERNGAMAWVAKAEGRIDEAVSAMRAAADLEDASEKNISMENRLFPMRELLGDMLLDMAQPAAALAAYEEALTRTPARVRSYYGAAKAAGKFGDTVKAKTYSQKLVAMCADADTVRRELEEARTILAKN
jgi:tetratricopeptide (TPR) repeat protein